MASYLNLEDKSMISEYDKLSNLEKQAIQLAQLLVSYAPESAFANQSPALYAMLFHRAKAIMESAGITPEANIRCWFWQIDAFICDRDNEKHLVMARLGSSPVLNSGLQQWQHPKDGHSLSEDEFRHLWRN